MITVLQLYHLLGDFCLSGHGGEPIILARDEEGNEFCEMDDDFSFTKVSGESVIVLWPGHLRIQLDEKEDA